MTIRRLTSRLSELIAETWPQVDERVASLAAYTLVRLVSHAARPGGPPEKVAAYVAEILGPFIGERLDS